ncbi:MAG: hypothetical protein WA104_00330 [Thermodesulfovibrionales bacterium]
MTKLMIIFRSRDILSYIITDGQKNKNTLCGRAYIQAFRQKNEVYQETLQKD